MGKLPTMPTVMILGRSGLSPKMLRQTNDPRRALSLP
jgi:hypothetical protein